MTKEDILTLKIREEIIIHFSYRAFNAINILKLWVVRELRLCDIISANRKLSIILELSVSGKLCCTYTGTIPVVPVYGTRNEIR